MKFGKNMLSKEYSNNMTEKTAECFHIYDQKDHRIIKQEEIVVTI